MSLCLSLVFWFFVGFYIIYKKWSFAYALFFAAQSGFGIGWIDGGDDEHVQRWWTRLITMTHCLIGNFMVMSAMELIIIHKARSLFERALDNSQSSDYSIRIWTRLEFSLLAAWFMWLFTGVFFAKTVEKLDIPAAFLYATTELTTAGLIPPKSVLDSKKPSFPLCFSTIYLLIGVPLTAALGTVVWAKIFALYERRQKRRIYLETLLARRLTLSKGVSEATLLKNDEDRQVVLLQRRAFSLQSDDYSIPSTCTEKNFLNKEDSSLSSSSEWACFLENELIQTGLVDRRLIAEIRLSFLAVGKAIVASHTAAPAIFDIEDGGASRRNI